VHGIIPPGRLRARANVCRRARNCAGACKSANQRREMLATPCAINSTLGLCLSLLILSDTTADMSDSIAPSIATVSAEKIADEPCRNAVPARQNAEALWGFRQTAFLSFHSQVHQGHGRGRTKTHQNRAWHSALHISGRKSSRQRNHCKQCCLPVQSREGARQCRHPVKKNRPEL